MNISEDVQYLNLKDEGKQSAQGLMEEPSVTNDVEGRFWCFSTRVCSMDHDNSGIEQHKHPTAFQINFTFTDIISNICLSVQIKVNRH